MVRPPAPQNFQGQQPLWDLIERAPPQRFQGQQPRLQQFQRPHSPNFTNQGQIGQQPLSRQLQVRIILD